MASHRILLTAGSNAKGQLGIGTTSDAHTFTPCHFAGYEPHQLPDPTARVAHVACGANHTVLLLQHRDASTTLWGAGDGRRGQLGPAYACPGEESGREPEQQPWTVFHELVLPLPNLEDASARGHLEASGYTYTDVVAAWETTYVVLARPGRSDVLLAMGSNEFGTLGVGEGAGHTRAGEPRIVDLDHIFPEDAGRQSVPPPTLCVRSLHAGPRHVVAELVLTTVDENGLSCSQTVLVGWGASRHGQLGENGGVRVVARPARLPIDIDEDPMVSCALGNQHTVVLHASGRISALGSNKQAQIPLLGSQMRMCGLGCTWNGTFMQRIDGDKYVLLSIGNNAQGQLGRGCTVESASTVDKAVVSLPADRAMSGFVCGSEHVLAMMSSSSQEGNSVVGWGWNEHGNMGLGSLGNITIPTQLWPRKDTEAYNKYPQRVIGIWAGCATSWLLVE
ncbi:RCC1/BLIP-II [Imleria badia]|nr:RCC1/BLIP-II [Imleria badia]